MMTRLTATTPRWDVPGPAGIPLLGSALDLRRDLLGTLEKAHRRYGDVVTFSSLFDSNFVMVFEPELVKQVGIGTHVRMVFSDVSDGIALPQWTIDETAQQPAKVWRYAQE